MKGEKEIKGIGQVRRPGQGKPQNPPPEKADKKEQAK